MPPPNSQVFPPVGKVLVHAARAEVRAVADERTGATPQLPIQAGLHRLHRFGIGFGRVAEGNVDRTDFADDAVADQLRRHAEFLGRALLGAGLEHALGGAHRFHQLDGFAHTVGQRLLAIDIFAGFHRRDGNVGMPVVGRGDHSDVDVLSGQELAEVVVRIAAFVLRAGLGRVEIVHSFLGVLAAGGVDIADGHDLNVIPIEEIAEVSVHLVSHADASDGESFARGTCLRPHSSWENERRGNEQGRLLEEATAGGGCERHRGVVGCPTLACF
jgi:hypothetical protein